MKAGYLVGALLLGAGFGSSWRLVSTMVEAAPREVFGSSNIAVDTFVNNRGSFTLMSDGTVFSLKNGRTEAGVSYQAGTTDLGHPFSDPPATAKITSPTAVQGKISGSANIAVKALVRSDHTYVVFADGTVKMPANADAAAAASGNRTITGTLTYSHRNPQSAFTVGGFDFNNPSLVLTGDGFQIGAPSSVPRDAPFNAIVNTAANGDIPLAITFDTPFSSPPSIFFSGMPYYTPACVPYTDGFVVIFYKVGTPPAGNYLPLGGSLPQMTFMAVGN